MRSGEICFCSRLVAKSESVLLFQERADLHDHRFRPFQLAHEPVRCFCSFGKVVDPREQQKRSSRLKFLYHGGQACARGLRHQVVGENEIDSVCPSELLKLLRAGRGQNAKAGLLQNEFANHKSGGFIVHAQNDRLHDYATCWKNASNNQTAIGVIGTSPLRLPVSRKRVRKFRNRLPYRRKRHNCENE